MTEWKRINDYVLNRTPYFAGASRGVKDDLMFAKVSNDEAQLAGLAHCLAWVERNEKWTSKLNSRSQDH